MNNNERPPTPQEKQQIKNQVRDKTETVLIQEFLNVQNDAESLRRDIDDPANEDKIQLEQGVPKLVRDKQGNEQKFHNVIDAVRQTIEAIKVQKVNRLDQAQIPSQQILITLVNSISLEDINSRNAPYIYEVLHRGMEGRLGTTDQLIESLRAIKNLEYTDKNIFERVSNVFQGYAQDIGASKEQLLNLKSKEQKEIEKERGIDETKEKAKERRQDYVNIKREVDDIIDGIDVGRIKGTRYERDIQNMNKDEITDRGDLERLKQEKREMKVDDIKRELKISFYEILGKPSDVRDNREFDEHDIERNAGEFRKKIDKYLQDGILTSDEHERLADKIYEMKRKGQEFVVMAHRIQQKNMFEIASHYTDISWSRNEEEVLNGLNSVDSLIELSSKKYNGFSNREDWEDFEKDIRGIFDRLFSIPESQPNEFWQNAFNPMYEGHLYKLLIQRLSSLGRDIMNDSRYRDKKVLVWDFYNKQDEFQSRDTVFGPNTRLTNINYKPIDLGSAIGAAIRDDMIRLGNLKEYIHNIDIISNKGLGFDKIAEYSSSLSVKDVDWLFRSTPYLTEAYNLYLQEMMQELSLNGHILPTDFGNKNRLSLDPVEQRVYKQLAVKMGVTTMADQEIIRLIHAASGISKGVYGEFWGNALTSRMPIGYDVIRNPDGTIKEIVYKPIFQSLHVPGLEKMLTSIDFDLIFQRMKLPRYYRNIRYAYAPREFNKHKENFNAVGHDVTKEALDEFHRFEHGNIYKFGKLSESAWHEGRTDELAEFDDKYRFMHEFFKTSSIDYFLRSAWRFNQNRNFFVWITDQNGKVELTPDGRPKLNFEATVKKLKGIGPFAVKYFIDDIFGKKADFTSPEAGEQSPLTIENVDPHVYNEVLNRLYPGKTLSQLNKEQKSHFNFEVEISFYEKYIFKEFEKIRPTQFINMEQKRYTPKGEDLLSERLVTRLKGMYGAYDQKDILTTILPVHIGAIELVENELWERHKRGGGDSWKKRMDNFSFDSNGDPLNYVITEADFDDPEIKRKLIHYFQLSKGQVGQQPQKGGFFSLEDENFINHVKESFMTLKEGIADPERKYRVTGNTKQTLTHRYAYMMKKQIGMIDNYIKGNLFDFQEYFLQQAGSRGPERMWGEVQSIAQKFTPKLRELVMYQMPAFIKEQYPDLHTMEAKAKEIFGPAIKEMCDAIEVIDIEQAHGQLKYLITMITELMGKDWWMRYKILGSMGHSFLRRSFETQGSFMADHFKETLRRPVTTLDTEGMEAVAHTLTDLINMPHDEKRITGYKTNLFGHNLIPEFGEVNSHTMEQVIEALNAEPKQRFKEAIPVAPFVIAFILFMLAKLALDKDKKKG